VREIFARRSDVPERSCPHCGEQARTRHEHCPACGRSYFDKPHRFSVRTRRILQAAGAVLVAIVAVIVVRALINQAHDNKARTRAQQAAAVAAERARLAHEQRPHHALASGLRDRGRGAPAASRLQRRERLVQRLEASITDDARGRIVRHELSASAITATRCHAFTNRARGDELDLRKTLGRYSCEAAVGEATNKGLTSTLGVPFVGTIDFARGRLTWCKDNPVSASDVKQTLAFVRLARECTAAHGPAFGSGYLIEPQR
jgi:hypothetical protein